MQETAETRAKLANAIRDLQAKGDTESINRLVSAYKIKYHQSAPQPIDKKDTGLSGFSTGFVQSGLKTLEGLGNLIVKPLEAGYRKVTGKEPIKTGLPERVLEARTPAMQVGQTAGTIAQYVAPVGRVNTLTKGLSTLPRIAARTLPDVAVTAGQTGGDLKSIAGTGVSSAVLNAIVPGSKAIRQVGAGYISDVATGLSGQRGQDREGLSALIPGVGTLTTGALVGTPKAFNAIKDKIETTFSTDKFVQKRTKAFEDLFNSGVRTKNFLEKSKQKDIDIPKILASDDRYVPEVIDGKVVPDKAIVAIQGDIEPMAKTIREVIDTESAKVNIGDWYKLSLAKIDNLKLSGNKYNKAKANIDADFQVYAKQADQDGLVSLSFLDDVKKAKYGDINWDKPIANASNRAVAKSARELIENSIEDVSIRQMNRELGSLYDAQEALENLGGRAVKGGRLGKYFSRTLGVAVGSQGGIPGAVLGGVTADKLSDLMQSSYFNNPIVKRFIGDIQRTRPDIFNEAQQIINSRKAQRATQLKLPAGAIRMGGGKDKSGIDKKAIEELKEYYRKLDAERSIKLPSGQTGAISGKTIPLGSRSQSTIDAQEMARIQSQKNIAQINQPTTKTNTNVIPSKLPQSTVKSQKLSPVKKK